jgi:uncharacterized lipoprotein YehR (DUF1307 family)
MKKNGLNKLLALLLALVMVLALAACGNKAQDNGGAGDDANVVTDGTVADGATVGKGATAFTVEVAQLDGTSITFTVNTDKATVGEALLELGIVAGDDTEYGLYVKTVNGVTLDYDTDGAYWAFYINGEYAMTGVDATNIEAGAIYALKAEKAEG